MQVLEKNILLIKIYILTNILKLLLIYLLIFLTFKVLFQKDNTEGIEAWQTSAATKENLEKIEKG